MNRFRACFRNRSGDRRRAMFWVLAGALLAATYFAATGSAQEVPEWTGSLRRDHPRLFFNADTWPQVRARALGAERPWYDQTKRRVDRLLETNQGGERMDVKDYGVEAAWSAFVFRVTHQPQYLELAQRCLDASLRYYDACFAERKSVNWYSTSRVHATLAWDWLFEDLPEATRRETMERLVRAIDRVLEADPPIYRENLSGYNTGFYGVRNCLWFIGCTAYGTGIASEKVNEWLVWGRNENLRLLEHRRQACGDDGGGASATLGYLLGAYPWSEQNFFYTWLSATGENIAPDWPHSAWLANYAMWNWIESERGPREFGYGDTDHTRNAMPVRQLYTHLANIRHLFGTQRPLEAGLARYVQQRLPEQRYSRTWFVYPFLLTALEEPAEPFAPERLPAARHFENMGQVIMRSGTESDDTYCLFSCGGTLRQHRHYDALNFVIYHQGFLALDSGTRYKEFDNGQHLANYFAQTVAHNCVVIHQEGEPAASYWGGKVVGNHGGQHRQLGSEVKAFETNDAYVYVAGDATACYQHRKANLGEKCELVTRQVVFLMPHHFVIFDRVVSTDAAYRKEWLLHTAREPSIDGQTIRAEHGQGTMLCRTLLPRAAALRTVGGPGKAYWAAGRNWDLVEDGLTDENRGLIGQWRVEVTRELPQRAEEFLHVIQVGDRQMTHMDAVELMERGSRHGVRLTTDGQTWEVLFDSEGRLGGSIRRTGEGPRIARELSRRVQPQVGIAARAFGAMTLQQAEARIPQRELPGFWVGDLSTLEQRLAGVKRGEVSVIARTPGKRPLHCVRYGSPEPVKHKANFNSAVGGRLPSAYLDKEARYKPVILFVGPVHGHEVEGLTGLVNLIEVMETGKDLLGRDQRALQALGERCRLLIIPAGNPDGVARLKPRALQGMDLDDLRFWGQGTWSDHTFCGWPESKQQHPMAGNNVGFLGCYFNDDGINPMHDEFFAPMGPEAPAILRVAQTEGPDLAVSLHSHGSKPALLRPAYVPREIQEDIRSLAGVCYGLCDQRRLPRGSLFETQTEGGAIPAPFNLTSALYHVSGASSFTFECPHGLVDAQACHVGLVEILDIQLSLYEAMMRHELRKKEHP